MKRVPSMMIRTLLLVTAVGLASCERPPMTSQQIGYRGVAMEQNYHPATYKALQAKNVPPPVIPSMGSMGPLAVNTYKNVKVLTDLTVPELTRVMLAMTAWVAPPDKSCSYCHAADMASDEIYQKVVARRMLQMVRNINTNWGAHVAGTGVTCYTCHRGQAVPARVWYINPAERELPFLGDRALQNSPAPTVGYASLPYDPYPSFLLAGHDIKVGGTTALPSGNRQSLKQAEWTYGLMMNISAGLGVNCTYCHNSRSFRDWDQSTPARAKAWHAIRMVRQLNNDYLAPLASTFPPERLGPTGDTAKVNCATCHQGVFKPMFGQGGAADYPELREKPHADATRASASGAAGATGAGAP
jgi:photosynthetic reaction center cytochrome c subunit